MAVAVMSPVGRWEKGSWGVAVKVIRAPLGLIGENGWRSNLIWSWVWDNDGLG